MPTIDKAPTGTVGDDSVYMSATDGNKVFNTLRRIKDIITTLGGQTILGLTTLTNLVVTGTSTHGGDVVSDTDSTDDIGSTGVRWLNGWFDNLTVTTDITRGTDIIYPSVLQTELLTTSGTTKDFTGIPSWVKKITVMFSGVSTNGITDLTVQIGDSGGFETAGYLGAVFVHGGATIQNYGAGFDVTSALASISIVQATMVLHLMDSSAFTWSALVNSGQSDQATGFTGAGTKSLTAALTQVRITTLGADTFDAGSVNIIWE